MTHSPSSNTPRVFLRTGKGRTSSLHHFVDFALDVELRVFGFDAFKLDGNFFSGSNVRTEIDVSEGAAADLPAQPVPVPDSELHGGGGGGSGSLLPSRPLPGSELGEAAPLLPLRRVGLPAPPPSRPRFHHRFPAAPLLPAPQYGADGTVRAPPPLLRPPPTPLALSPPRMDSDLPGLNPPSAA